MNREGKGKPQTENKIFTKHIFDRSLAFKIYKEFSKPKIIIRLNHNLVKTQFKVGKDMKRNLAKKLYRRQISIEPS